MRMGKGVDGGGWYRGKLDQLGPGEIHLNYGTRKIGILSLQSLGTEGEHSFGFCFQDAH